MYWTDWLKTLLSLVVLLGILEHLLPSGELAKFSKLVLGLALMLAVLQPLTLLLNQDPGSFDIDVSWLDAISDEPDVQILAERVQLAAAAPFLRQEQEAVVSSLESALLATENITDVRVEIDSMGQANCLVQVFLHPFEADTRQTVIATVAATLNLPENQIQVQRWSE